jgi:TldD protein
VPADQWLIVEKGVFKDYQTTREQVARIQKLTGVSRSHGCSFGESWNAVQFQRMPNISLLPGDKDLSVNDIVAATERGILIRNTGSWSIDHQRYNFSSRGRDFTRFATARSSACCATSRIRPTRRCSGARWT